MSKLVHKNEVKVGDAIMFNGKFRTVCAKDIQQCHFMGRTIFGDSFVLGRVKVEVKVS